MKTFRFSIPITFRFSVEADTKDAAQQIARMVVAQLAGEIYDLPDESAHSAYGALEPSIIHGSDETKLDEGELAGYDGDTPERNEAARQRQSEEDEEESANPKGQTT